MKNRRRFMFLVALLILSSLAACAEGGRAGMRYRVTGHDGSDFYINSRGWPEISGNQDIWLIIFNDGEDTSTVSGPDPPRIVPAPVFE